MVELPHCAKCGLPLTRVRADAEDWMDPQGWFVSEEPTLHAHRPAKPQDVVVVLNGSSAA